MHAVEANPCPQRHAHFPCLFLWVNDVEAEQEIKMSQWQQSTMDRGFQGNEGTKKLEVWSESCLCCSKQMWRQLTAALKFLSTHLCRMWHMTTSLQSPIDIWVFSVPRLKKSHNGAQIKLWGWAVFMIHKSSLQSIVPLPSPLLNTSCCWSPSSLFCSSGSDNWKANTADLFLLQSAIVSTKPLSEGCFVKEN